MKTVNKIVASLLAAASFPLLITQMFINIVLSVDKDSTAYTLINLLFGSDNKLTNNSLGIQYSLVMSLFISPLYVFSSCFDCVVVTTFILLPCASSDIFRSGPSLVSTQTVSPCGVKNEQAFTALPK